MTQNPDGLPRHAITMTILRSKTREIVERACYGQSVFVVHLYGTPVVVVIGVEQWEALFGKVNDETSAADPTRTVKEQSNEVQL